MGGLRTTDIYALQTRIEAVLPTLNEYQRRRYLSAEAKAIGQGGISLVSRMSGMSRLTLTEGLKELDDPNAEIMKQGRSRKAEAGARLYGRSSPVYLKHWIKW